MVFSWQVNVNRQNHRETQQNTRRRPIFGANPCFSRSLSDKLRAETGLRFGAFQTMLT
jgi:hypothetical protein